jgi:sigma-B regulation protein RsbU (phosphoserine phosphatase)
MSWSRRPWQEELEIIDRVMKAVSGVREPEELVQVYWEGVDELVPIEHYLALSRRGVEAPDYLITRSARFAEHFNPWTQRERLPRLSGGLLGEIAYANAPVVIDDLPSRLRDDDPGHFFLEGYGSLVALPQYESGEGLNITIMLFAPGEELDRAIIPMMHWQAGLFGRGTHNLVLRNQLEGALANLDRELQTVGEIQRSLLPEALPDIPGFQLAASYRTSARAGGDYYDFFPLASGAWGLFIADVSGHGTPAAVLMAITHAIAHALPGTHEPPAQLLAQLNDRLARTYTRDGTFITAFYGVLEPRSRRLTYSLAGHNPPRLARRGSVTGLDHPRGLPLGILPEESYEDETLTLEIGDLLVLYTDGITEAMTPPAGGGSGPRELFGVERLDALLVGCETDCSPSECDRRVRAAVAEFTGDRPPTDDRTLIVMRCV